MSGPRKLSENFVHLGLGATAEEQPPFTGMEWYADYGARYDQRDGREGRLVSHYAFSESWDNWEMHPQGDEVVICTEGRMTLIQDMDGEHKKTTLAKGEYAINPAGVWHTADVDGHAGAIFITAGLGTEHKPR